ncbi:MAG: FecR domain-containing protein [Marinilabiliaceae bacterium]|nr:FecR domain-containing protein [Marinilabiliaceae bacterium]
MEKNWKDIDILITKHLTNSISQEERHTLDQWKGEDPSNALRFDEMVNVWNHSEGLQAFQNIDMQLDLATVKKRIHFEQPNKKIRRMKFASRIAAIMIPAVMFVAGFALYQSTPGFGKWQAFNTQTQNGEVTLPDHSNVTLNQNSRLVFLKKMQGDKRLIKFQGEGYFKVAKNPDKPFVIEVGKANVEVLGTEFNLEENAVTGRVCIAVTEGKVRFWSGKQEEILLAGDRAVFENGTIHKKTIDNDNFLSWKTGVISFTNANLEEVSAAIQDHFDDVNAVQVKTNTDLTDLKITTKFINPSLQEVLDELMIHSDKKIEWIDGKLIISD